MTLAIIVWDGLVRYSTTPSGWWLPLGLSLLALLVVFWACGKGLDRLEDWRERRERAREALRVLEQQIAADYKALIAERHRDHARVLGFQDRRRQQLGAIARPMGGF